MSSHHHHHDSSSTNYGASTDQSFLVHMQSLTDFTRELETQLDGLVKIPMKYFTAAAEASLVISSASDNPTLTFDTPFWTSMVERSRYVLAQKAGSTTLSAISR